MGKHNGRSRKTGLTVGKSLENVTKQSRRQPQSDAVASRQSVLDQGNVDSVMALADLARKDYATERQRVVLLDSSSAPAMHESSMKEIIELQRQFGDSIKIPRRPEWTRDQSLEELDRKEKESFLNWRRSLAFLEESQPNVTLTPYEKNLEVWRQLWRVLERSHILVQVVDARNPMFYYSQDLVRYAKELCSATETLVLLNKADLVEFETRQKWADYFDNEKILYAFWSAKAALEDSDLPLKEDNDHRVTVFRAEQVTSHLESLAARTIKEQDKQSPTVVGLVGYPNVGKSSTINALFGRKKTPVAPTPGRTKHFQTLFVRDDLCLCDCPGLVLPALAKSKAEMVAAGVIPVDRLTDVVAPVSVILSRVGLEQFSCVYGLKLTNLESDTVNAETAVKAMAVLAASRGWFQAAGLPDQTKTGRQIIKDYLTGKLLHCELPAEQTIPSHVSAAASDMTQDENGVTSDRIQCSPVDDELLKACCGVDDTPSNTKLKTRRPSYKFHKKAPRRKMRGREYDADTPSSIGVNVKGHKGSIVNGML